MFGLTGTVHKIAECCRLWWTEETGGQKSSQWGLPEVGEAAGKVREKFKTEIESDGRVELLK